MNKIQESQNENKWPRKEVKTIDCRKRDLIVRIADWSRDRDEPAFDVEVYVGGVYDFNESLSFTKREYGTLRVAKAAAIRFSATQIAKLL